jgi:hypothetical protein
MISSIFALILAMSPASKQCVELFLPQPPDDVVEGLIYNYRQAAGRVLFMRSRPDRRFRDAQEIASWYGDRLRKLQSTYQFSPQIQAALDEALAEYWEIELQ